MNLRKLIDVINEAEKEKDNVTIDDLEVLSGAENDNEDSQDATEDELGVKLDSHEDDEEHHSGEITGADRTGLDDAETAHEDDVWQDDVSELDKEAERRRTDHGADMRASTTMNQQVMKQAIGKHSTALHGNRYGEGRDGSIGEAFDELYNVASGSVLSSGKLPSDADEIKKAMQPILNKMVQVLMDHNDVVNMMYAQATKNKGGLQGYEAEDMFNEQVAFFMDQLQKPKTASELAKATENGRGAFEKFVRPILVNAARFSAGMIRRSQSENTSQATMNAFNNAMKEITDGTTPAMAEKLKEKQSSGFTKAQEMAFGKMIKDWKEKDEFRTKKGDFEKFKHELTIIQNNILGSGTASGDAVLGDDEGGGSVFDFMSGDMRTDDGGVKKFDSLIKGIETVEPIKKESADGSVTYVSPKTGLTAVDKMVIQHLAGIHGTKYSIPDIAEIFQNFNKKSENKLLRNYKMNAYEISKVITKFASTISADETIQSEIKKLLIGDGTDEFRSKYSTTTSLEHPDLPMPKSKEAKARGKAKIGDVADLKFDKSTGRITNEPDDYLDDIKAQQRAHLQNKVGK